jgi:hypothetical protein
MAADHTTAPPTAERPSRFRARARGQAVGSCVHWIMATLITMTFPIIAARSGGLTFWFYASMMVLQLLWVVFLMPETQCIPLEEIEAKLARESRSIVQANPAGSSALTMRRPMAAQGVRAAAADSGRPATCTAGARHLLGASSSGRWPRGWSPCLTPVTHFWKTLVKRFGGSSRSRTNGGWAET